MTVADEATIRIRLQPRASGNEIVGWKDEILSLRLTAPPVDGAANAACVEFLAKTLGVKKAQVEIVSGQKSRDKRVRISGLSQADAEARLGRSA